MTKRREEELQPLLSGEWGSSATWEFFESEDEPNPRLCSAIACVAITNLVKGEFVITLNDRGWEIIAGGIDPIDDMKPRRAVRREGMEEGGIVVPDLDDVLQYGYREIKNHKLTPEARRKGYPPLAYMPYYHLLVTETLQEPTGIEIKDRKIVDLEEAAKMLKPEEFILAEAGLKAARRVRLGR